MDSSLSPREIQSRIRAGASVDEVAEESGSPAERVQVFAAPVLAEREHMARSALGATVRRRGDGTGHRRLGEIIEDRLRARSIDAEEVSWDAWREPDLRWRVVGRLDDDAAGRVAEFLFDSKGRFSIADNADARWMIGEELTGSGPDNENTVDFDDELALVRATQSTGTTSLEDAPGDDVPVHPEAAEGAYTSELDELYDMLSGVSEDSVRIYVGLDDDHVEPAPEDPASDTAPRETPGDDQVMAPEEAGEDPDDDETEATRENLMAVEDHDAPAGHADPEPLTEPRQDSLIDADPEPPAPKKSRRRRAQVPSWDEIMFGK